MIAPRSNAYAHAIGVLVLAGCSTTTDPGPCVAPTIETAGPIEIGSGAATVYWSSESDPFDRDHPDYAWFDCPRGITHAFERQPDVPLETVADAAPTVLMLDPSSQHQLILGTGISMEESSVVNLRALSPAKRAELLARDPVSGMGLQVVRVTIGTSDFTGTDWYTYDDGTPDPDLARFSIATDIDVGILDVLQQIRAISPRVVFFASPWSPPAWMKEGGRITGGRLKSEMVPIYAAYLRKFVEAYRDAGIPIAALTLQNEPRADDPAMPSCFVPAEQEAAIAIAVKHELAAAGLATKVWIYDHNFDAALDYTGDLFAAGSDARAASDGVAFHDYAGDPSAIADVAAHFPEQDMVFTERTLWGIGGVDRVAQYFRNGSTSYVSWVTMLDQHGLPNKGPNFQKLRRFVRSLDGDDYWATPEHFLFGLYSRFVQPGARRIASDYGDAGTVTDVAFTNPDGTIAVIVANQTDATQDFTLRTPTYEVRAALPAHTAGAYAWRVGAPN
jgi:glucosylceramidase